MTKTDFESIEKIFFGDLSASGTLTKALALRGSILSLADYFGRVNPRFNRSTFYAACGLTEDGFISTRKMPWLFS